MGLVDTDPAARRLLAIGLHGCGASEVLLLTPPGHGCPDGARPFRTEKDLLAGFCARVRDLDPDVLTGWNVVDFDLTVLDGIHLLRGAFVRMDDYGLDAVARAVLTATGPSSPRASSGSSTPGPSPTVPSSTTCARWSRTCGSWSHRCPRSCSGEGRSTTSACGDSSLAFHDL